MMIQPKISVVTVCYNAVNDIEKTILSVINQSTLMSSTSSLMEAQRMVRWMLLYKSKNIWKHENL